MNYGSVMNWILAFCTTVVMTTPIAYFGGNSGTDGPFRPDRESTVNRPRPPRPPRFE
jgi:hypothetical protein